MQKLKGITELELLLFNLHKGVKWESFFYGTCEIIGTCKENKNKFVVRCVNGKKSIEVSMMRDTILDDLKTEIDTEYAQ